VAYHKDSDSRGYDQIHRAVLDEEEEGVKELMPNWSASYQFGHPGRYMFITNLQFEQGGNTRGQNCSLHRVWS
jgi:hypothetical protein